MAFDGFKIDLNARSEAEVCITASILKTNEHVTIDDKITDLFEALRGSIFNYLIAVFGRGSAVEAEDIIQEAFLQLHRYLQKGHQIDNPRAWLFRVAHNLAINRLKSTQFIAPLDDLAWEDICQRLPDPASRPNSDMQTKADVIEYDTVTGKSRAIFNGGPIADLSLSPNGEHLMVLCRAPSDFIPVTQRRYDVYIVSTNPGQQPLFVPQDGKKTGNRTAYDGNGNVIAPTAPGVKMSYTPVMSWAPTSDRIAWTETGGGYAKGDLMVLDVTTGQTRNLTETLVLPPNARDLDNNNPNQNNTATFFGKFGNSDAAPVWDADGTGIYVRRSRKVPRSVNLYGICGEVWRVSAANGEAANLKPDADFSHTLVVQNGGTVWARPGGKGELILAVRFLNDDASGFVAFDPKSRRAVTLARFRGTATQDRVTYTVAPGGNLIVFRNERSDLPQELFGFDVARAAVTQLTDLNRSVAEKRRPEMRRITWIAAGGDRAGGLLFLPPRKPGENSAKPPLVVSVYPGNGLWYLRSIRSENYAGGITLFWLLEQGYAVLLPDVELTGQGNACKEITANTIIALKAAGDTELVDADRAGVIGESFGGFSVNCIVTHSSNFRAAVSMVGMSDLFSYELIKGVKGGGQIKLFDRDVDIESKEAIGKYISDSPVYYASKVTTPLLLLHGKKDGNVNFLQSFLFYRAIERANKARVRLVGYDDLGHGTSSDSRAKAEYLKWFDEYLKPQPPKVASTTK
jgi:dipeptidyl aminopeptidase/acylaminoacyl peptidase